MPDVTHLPHRQYAWGLRRHNPLHRSPPPLADRQRRSPGSSRTHRTGPVSPSSTSSTSTIIGLSHSGHTTAMIEPPGTWSVHPPISTTLIGLWEQLLADNPRYLFSGLPAHSSSIRLQQHLGFHTRRTPVTVGPRLLAHFNRLTVVPSCSPPAFSTRNSRSRPASPSPRPPPIPPSPPRSSRSLPTTSRPSSPNSSASTTAAPSPAWTPTSPPAQA